MSLLPHTLQLYLFSLNVNLPSLNLLTPLMSRVLSFVSDLLSINPVLHHCLDLLVLTSCSLHALCFSCKGPGSQWGLTSLLRGVSRDVKLPYLIPLIKDKPKEDNTHTNVKTKRMVRSLCQILQQTMVFPIGIEKKMKGTRKRQGRQNQAVQGPGKLGDRRLEFQPTVKQPTLIGSVVVSQINLECLFFNCMLLLVYRLAYNICFGLCFCLKHVRLILVIVIY